MSNYVNDYNMASDEDKLLQLQLIYRTANKEEREIIAKEVQKIYNSLRGRE